MPSNSWATLAPVWVLSAVWSCLINISSQRILRATPVVSNNPAQRHTLEITFSADFLIFKAGQRAALQKLDCKKIVSKCKIQNARTLPIVLGQFQWKILLNKNDFIIWLIISLFSYPFPYWNKYLLSSTGGIKNLWHSPFATICMSFPMSHFSMTTSFDRQSLLWQCCIIFS